jgi:hypothetical protein
MAVRLFSDTLAVPFKMRETVLGDTPALRATSSKVDGGAVLSSSIKSVPVIECGGKVSAFAKFMKTFSIKTYHNP